jgi:hypothetical protein
VEQTGYDHELDQLVVEVGDIAVSPQWVYLPGGGQYPLRNSMWELTDQVQEVTEIPPYAVVLAVIFFAVFMLGLLFLLIKEYRVQGVVQVVAEGEGFVHVTQVPVASQQGVNRVHHRVDYIRGLAAAA